MNRFRLALLATLLLGTAQSARLIGTSGPFASSGVCRAHHCTADSVLPLTGALRLFTYTLDSRNPRIPNLYRVVRSGQRIVATGYRTGGQDWAFGQGFEANRQLGDLIAATTGWRPSAAWIDRLSYKTLATGVVGTNRFQVGTKPYTVACVTSPGAGFLYADVSIY